MGGCGGTLSSVVGGWAAVQWTTCLQTAAFGGTLWCVGRCCRGRGSRARHSGGGRGEKVVRTTWGSWAAVFRDNAMVQWAVLLRERRRCNGQQGGMQRCVCILFAHGHGQDPLEGGGGSHYHNRIRDRDPFFRKRYFFSTFFLARVFT